MKRALIVFAKEPVPGKVKTRMRPVLTAQQSAELAAALIQDTAELMGRVQEVARVVAYAPFEARLALQELVGSDFEYWPQPDGNLGKRMEEVFDRAFEEGYEKAVIIGADSPSLPAEWVQQAFENLGSGDLVLGPTYDGGYYLIGLRRPRPSLFKGIKWSTAEVLPRTLDIVEREGIPLHLLPPWNDLDTPESFAIFRTQVRGLELSGDPSLPSATARFLSRLE